MRNDIRPHCTICGKVMGSVETGDLVVCDECKKQKEKPLKCPDCGEYKAHESDSAHWMLCDKCGIVSKPKKTIRLNLGCGNRYLRGYVHIDKDLDIDDYLNSEACQLFYQEGKPILDQFPHPWYHGDVTDLYWFKDNSVDEIYASHVLDHLSRKNELDKALSEWYRVLKPGGILRVAVSDFEKVVKMYNEGLDLERLWGHLVGGQKSQYDRHGVCFDYNTLKKYLDSHGFIDIKRYRWQDFLPEGFDDFSQAYIPHMDKKEGILMSLNVQCKKPL